MPPISDAAFARALRPAGWLVIALPLAIVAFLIRGALPALSEYGVGGFVASATWAPTSGQVGLLKPIAGTFVATLGAMAIAAPLSVAYAVWVHAFAGRWAAPLRMVVSTMAGIPSVVFGLCALLTVVPVLLRFAAPGLGVGAAVVVLVAMVLPVASEAADAAIAQVDSDVVTAARGLGLGACDAMRVAVLPLASRGIRAGLLLATGRAIGETMAVMMVAGNTIAWPTTLATPFRTLTGNVAIEMAYATGLHRSALFVGGVVLLALVGCFAAVRR